MACNCGKNRNRPAWQPRGSKRASAPAGNAGARIVQPAERSQELANGRPARAKQPGGR